MFYIKICSALLYILIALFLWKARPGSSVYNLTCEQWFKKKDRWHWVVCVSTILFCTIPMSFSPNVTNPEKLNQPEETATLYHLDHYEQLAESFLQGHLYYNYKVDERLINMNNPYDITSRENQNVPYHFDHAYYKGHYYMYFGVVPVVLLFLPFRLITGHALLGYHGTQIFVALFILAIFVLFKKFVKFFFNKLPVFVYYLYCISIIIMSVWYAVSVPMVYAFAQVAAFTFLIWGISFWFEASFNQELSTNKIILNMTIGALLGALSFGCRPTIAMFNLMIIPFIFLLIRSHRKGHFYLKLLWVTVPYILVGICLMWYNYARFDNPFEFGQAYQLTNDDQSSYIHPGSRISLSSFFDSLKFYFYRFPSYRNLQKFGLIYTNPIITLGLFLLLFKKTHIALRRNHLSGIIGTAIISILVIVLCMSVFAPWPLPRYRMDFIWFLGIIAFLVIGIVIQSYQKKLLLYTIALCSLATILICFIQFFTPYDSNLSDYCPEAWLITKQILIPWY